MKIEYIHHSMPTKKKIYDTVKSLKNNPQIHMSQSDFDAMELRHMEDDKANGTIIDYKILEEFDL